MYGNESYTLPIGLAMSLSSNKEAFKIFLSMSNEEQDNLIGKAREMKTVRELQKMVDSLPQAYGATDLTNKRGLQ